MRKSILPLALAAELLLFASGCSIFHRRRVSAAPSPAPPPAAAPIPEPRPSEPVIAAPKLPPSSIEAPKQEAQTAPPLPTPPETPKAKPRRRAARQPAVQPVPEPKPESPAQPAAPPPRLGDVLSAAQRQELITQLDGNLAEAQRLLLPLAGRRLTREQSETAARVRSFIQQAQGIRDSDLGTAAELSRRAVLLARDLAAAVR